MMNTLRYSLLSGTVLVLGMQIFGHAQSANDGVVRMNQIQVIGSHNSYHAGIAASEARLLNEKNPKLAKAFDYRHRPLDQQLDSPQSSGEGSTSRT